MVGNGYNPKLPNIEISPIYSNIPRSHSRSIADSETREKSVNWHSPRSHNGQCTADAVTSSPADMVGYRYNPNLHNIEISLIYSNNTEPDHVVQWVWTYLNLFFNMYTLTLTELFWQPTGLPSAESSHTKVRSGKENCFQQHLDKPGISNKGMHSIVHRRSHICTNKNTKDIIFTWKW